MQTVRLVLTKSRQRLRVSKNIGSTRWKTNCFNWWIWWWAQNLNQIPSAIIDRIEILRDGASAVYGSDAIAGVVNIITRKDFDGMDISVTSGSTEVGGGDYTRANITGGVSNSKGNIYYTFQHYDRRPQYYNEIPMRPLVTMITSARSVIQVLRLLLVSLSIQDVLKRT